MYKTVVPGLYTISDFIPIPILSLYLSLSLAILCQNQTHFNNIS